MDINPNLKYDDYDFSTRAPVSQPGHPGHLTMEQIAQVDQLRMMLEAEGYTKRLDTLTLLRFLRARKFDINAAKTMFVDCETWRKKTKLDDNVPTWDYHEKPEVFKYYPQFYHKTDKDGRPVYIEKLGGIDLNKMRKITTDERMLMNLAVEYERLADPRLPACSRKSGHLLETCCTVMDLKGVSIVRANQVYSYVSRASEMSQNYYPERLGRLFLINAPWGFSTVWGVVKGWLDPVTVQKIHVLGPGYQKELLEQVPKENLPVEYGGLCKCQGGCEFSDAGPWREPEWARPARWEREAAAAKEEEEGKKKEEAKKDEEGKKEEEEVKEPAKDEEAATTAAAATAAAPAEGESAPAAA